MNEDSRRTLETHLLTLDWQVPSQTAERLDCNHYSWKYRDLEMAAREKSLELDADAYSLLWKATSLHLRPSDPSSPFEPWIQLRTGRSPIIDDLSEEEEQVICQIAPLSANAELRARLADICWVTRRDHVIAELAVDAYLEVATELDNLGNWIGAKGRIEKAMRLAASLGKGGAESFRKVVTHIERTLHAIPSDDIKRKLQAWHLMMLLAEFDQGDAESYLEMSQQLAQLAEDRKDWETAQNYYQCAANWAKRLNNDELSNELRVLAAEQFVNIADEFLARENPDNLSASMQLSRAHEALRQARASERADEIHQQLVEIQPTTLEQMSKFSQEVDIGKLASTATESVKGKGFQESVVSFAVLMEPPSKEKLRETVVEYMAEVPLQFLFPTERVNSLGHVVAISPASFGDDESIQEEAIMAEVLQHAARHRWVRAGGVIEPARFQITLEHRVTLQKVMTFLLTNPLVPPRRELVVAKGLAAGFEGDYLLASHLLVPQLEHSLRAVLSREGVITTSKDQQGIQEERDLGWLLEHEKSQQLFGEDLIFDLRGLLVEPWGNNVRNEIAHGLLNSDELNSAYTAYLWGISLRYYCLPFIVRKVEQESPNL